MILEGFLTRQIRPFRGLQFRTNSTNSYSGCVDEGGEDVDVVMQLCIEEDVVEDVDVDTVSSYTRE